MEEVRKLNLMFNKGGSGSETARLAIPTTWVKSMKLNKEEKAVIAIAKKDHILIRKSTDTKKYLVISGDDINEEVDVFDDLTAANDFADTIWQHYTSAERKKGRVYVGVVSEEMLSPDAFNEDGEVEDWTAYWDLDIQEDFFDSENN